MLQAWWQWMVNGAQEPTPDSRPTLTEHDVLGKCNYFTDVQLWPLTNTLNPRRWLENFRDDEKLLAIYLLDSFLYYSEPLVDALFISTFHSLSNVVRTEGDSYLAIRNAWRDFNNEVIISPVRGERPSVTDSGLTFARKAKKLLDIPEERIMAPEDALRALLVRPRPVVFVDDFLGSGNQCHTTWHRQVEVRPSVSHSFASLASHGTSRFFYIPLVATQKGLDWVGKNCVGLEVHPAHVLPETYNAIHKESVIWPEHLREQAGKFLEKVSARAGIPDNNGNVNDWRGFHKLGLTIAFFNDAVPDATLPLFYWEENNWKPLLRRR
jgi:hypothetical protein